MDSLNPGRDLRRRKKKNKPSKRTTTTIAANTPAMMTPWSTAALEAVGSDGGVDRGGVRVGCEKCEFEELMLGVITGVEGGKDLKADEGDEP